MTGFKGVRPWSSGRFGVLLRHIGRRVRLDTFPTADIAARGYDAAAWRLGLSRERLNSAEIESQQTKELVGP